MEQQPTIIICYKKNLILNSIQIIATYGKDIEINIDAFLLVDGSINEYSREIIEIQ